MDVLGMLRGTSGQISLSRTQAAFGFLVCSGVIIWQAYKGELSDVTFGLFFAFTTGGYLGAKKIATDAQIEKDKMDYEDGK